MNATTYESAGEGWQDDQAELAGELPGRPRRRFLSPWSALIGALVAGAIGFFIGIEVEKGQLPSSSTSAAASTSAASRFRALFAGGASQTGSTGASRAGGGFPGFGGAGGGNAVGTVASVNGRTIYVTETSGNTVKVKLSSATKLTKAQTVGRSRIDPGDAVVVAGVSGAKGTISATSFTDSGARASSSSTGTSGSSTSSGSGSAVSSLFGG